jgi:hypothetical protein
MLQHDAVRKLKLDAIHELQILANQLIPLYVVSSISKFAAMQRVI